MTMRGFRSVFLFLGLMLTPCMVFSQVIVRGLSAGFASAVSSGGGFSIKVSAGEPVSGLTQGEIHKIGTGFWYADTEAKVPEAIEFELDLPGEIPADFQLHQNYPNPFNPVTSILISVPHRAQARLEVYDIIGRLVSVLFDEELPAGRHKVTWDARDEVGRSVASGVYVYRLVAGDFAETRTMILLK